MEMVRNIAPYKSVVFDVALFFAIDSIFIRSRQYQTSRYLRTALLRCLEEQDGGCT